MTISLTLCPVHGGIRIPKNILCLLIALIDMTNTNTRGHLNDDAAYGKGYLKHSLNLLGYLKGLLRALEIVDQKSELISPHARHGVFCTGTTLESLTDLEEQKVPGSMSESVIDRLESIQIEVDHCCPVFSGSLCSLERDAKAIHEIHSVSETGKTVMEC